MTAAQLCSDPAIQLGFIPSLAVHSAFTCEGVKEILTSVSILQGMRKRNFRNYQTAPPLVIAFLLKSPEFKTRQRQSRSGYKMRTSILVKNPVEK